MSQVIGRGSFWTYKAVIYRVSGVDNEVLSQDAEGAWVATVFYETEHMRGKKFARPITDFLNKFRNY